MKNAKEKILYVAVMALYGTTGILKRYVPLSSEMVSFVRAVIGSVFIYLFILLTGKKIDATAVKKNFKWILIVGILLGFNWICYFEACMYATVAKASLCYYMAPVIVILVSPVIFKEKLSTRKIICVVTAIIGMVLVSGVISDKGITSPRGIAMGLLAALIYASIVICSRQVKDISALDKTLVQLAIASVCLFFYVLAKNGFSQKTDMNTTAWIVLIIIGILNTGIAYIIYFGSITKLKAQTVAIFAYADPAVSVLLSALVLKEPLGIYGIVGALLIIGSMMLSEVENTKGT